MTQISIAQFAAIIHADPPSTPDSHARISSCATHSSRVGRESAFFALSGATTDGHRYVLDALHNGAAAAVVSREWIQTVPPKLLASDAVLLGVDDPLRALQRLAAWWRLEWDGKVLAVAGSSGKTMAKDALYKLLSASFRCSASPGSFNSQLGVPLAVLQTPEDSELSIFEAAFSEPDEIDRHRSILRPDFGVITNLGWTNISSFGSRAAVAAETVRLFANLPGSGWVLIPRGDEDLSLAASRLDCEIRRVGDPASGLPVLRSKIATPQGLELTMSFPDGTAIEFQVDSVQVGATPSVEIAACVGHLLGLAPLEIAEGLAHYSTSITRREVWKSPTGVTVINESDSADEISVQAALRSLKTLCGPGGRRLFLFGLDSANPDRDDFALIGELAAEYEVDELLVLGGAKALTAEFAFLSQRKNGEAKSFGSTDEAKAYLISRLRWGDALLVKGTAGAGVANVARNVIEAMAPTRFYVDLKAVAENVNRFRRLVGPHTKILAMLKALAYGSDSTQLAHELEFVGIDWIGVSSADEGVQLRRAGIRLPILVMMCTPEEVEKLPRYGLTPMVYSTEIAEAIARAAAAQNAVLDVHLEVDTGMGRTGILPGNLAEVARMLKSSGSLRLRGLMTHFPAADIPEEDEFTRRQIAEFNAIAAKLRDAGFGDLCLHAAATAGTIRFPEARLDMVRIGLGLYGMYPSPAAGETMDLVLAVALVSRIVEIQTHRSGAKIGYGRTHPVDRDGFRAAVVPAGYHDGIPWSAGSRGFVLVDGQRAPICGRISMDSMVVDVTEIPSARVGAEVLIYGRSGASVLRPEQSAEDAGTIVYELLAGLGPRVQRIFLGR